MVAVSRRGLLVSAALAAGGRPFQALAGDATGFTHGVASGDPTGSRVILWTRFVSPSPASVQWEIARDEGFRNIVRSGQATTSQARDYTIKVDADRLPPDSRLYYRFRRGTVVSPTGRTRTLPRGDARRLRLALFSCANLPFGYFNAYRHCAERDDIDIIVHVGDYIYEYPAGTYPSAADSVPGRSIAPAHETVLLADYRQRYQSYRSDADLQAVHAAFPMIAIWDDHEFANDTWRDGAENHQPDHEGLWSQRWRAAMRAYDEWMPVRSSKGGVHYRSFQWGNLASLIVLDTRFIGRDRPFAYKRDLHAISTTPRPEELAVAVKEFTPRWRDPRRTVLGAAQEAWLTRQLQRSAAQGTRWQLLAQQIQFGFVKQMPDTASYLKAGASDFVQSRVTMGSLVAPYGLPSNLDSWSGYPAARERLLAAVKAHGRNTLMLAGDTHNAWAFELPGGDGGRPLMIEIGGHSVASPGIERSFERLEGMTAALQQANPELKWAQLHGRGYVTVDLQPDGAEAQWLFLDTVTSRTFTIASRRTARILPSPGAGVGPITWA